MKKDSCALFFHSSGLTLWSSGISASIVSSSVLISQVSMVSAELTLTDLLGESWTSELVVGPKMPS